jgi:hypothetical protein
MKNFVLSIVLSALAPNPSQAALAERYRLAQAAKVIRQLRKKH